MTYTYKCNNHKKPLFAYKVQSMLEKLVTPKCVQCGDEMVRVYDAAPTHFHGTGWAGKER